MVNRTDPWRRHRFLKRVRVGSLLFVFLTSAFVLFGQIDVGSRDFNVLVGGWMLFVLVMMAVAHETRCPRCGQRFYSKGMDFWQMSEDCLHCGQHKYVDVATPMTDANGH
jgi:hypothetical protein